MGRVGSGSDQKDRRSPSLLTAIEYHRQGISVLPAYGLIDGHCACDRRPCWQPGRHLITDPATQTDVDESGLTAAWERHPYARPSIMAGPGSYVGLEISGDFASAQESLNRVLGVSLLLQTIELLDPRDRRVLLFRAPADRLVHRSARITDKVLFLGGGEWLIAPNPDCAIGSRAAWRCDGAIQISLLPELPEPVLDLLSSAEEASDRCDDGHADDDGADFDSYFSLGLEGK